MTVFDVLGKVVFKTTTLAKEINLQSIQAGIYLIRIKEGEQTSTKKLIIK
ncbi:T9SS type A sorting domain-containing protein [Synechococcus sp. BA-132 BA5]